MIMIGLVVEAALLTYVPHSLAFVKYGAYFGIAWIQMWLLGRVVIPSLKRRGQDS